MVRLVVKRVGREVNRMGRSVGGGACTSVVVSYIMIDFVVTIVGVVVIVT